MSRKAIYITVFSVVFIICFFTGRDASFIGFVFRGGFTAGAFLLIPYLYFRWSDQKKAGASTPTTPAPQPGITDGSNQLEGYARYFGTFLTSNDQTKKAKLNEPHYANIREADNALGGAFVSFTDIIKIRLHQLECCMAVMVDQLERGQENAQRIIDEMVTPYCPAGYLYIGGGFYWNGQGHILTVGAARSGKGTSLIVPALLNPFLALDAPNTPSFIVLDPKGENLAITGQWLKRAGYDLIVINPFGIPEVAEFGSHGFNVFSLFDASSPDFDKYARMVAFALLAESDHQNKFWDQSARSIIMLYIRHMMTQDEEPKDFRTIWHWLRLPSVTQDGTKDRIQLLEAMGESNAFEGRVAAEAKALVGQMAGGGREQVESMFAGVRAATDVFNDRRLLDAISRTDFDLTTIPKRKTALFVCMSPDDLADFKPFLRIVFGSLMRAMTQHYSTTRKLIMIMDEFIQMGSLNEFEVFSNYAAGIGAGITLWPIVQSLDDLQSVYPKTWQKFLNNTIIRHYVKVGDNFTAEYIQKRLPIVEDKTYIGERPLKPVKLHRIEEEMKNPLNRAIAGASAEWEIIQLKKQWQADLDSYERSARIDRRELLGVNDILYLNPILVEIDGCAKPVLFEKAPYYQYQQLGGNSASPNPFR